MENKLASIILEDYVFLLYENEEGADFISEHLERYSDNIIKLMPYLDLKDFIHILKGTKEITFDEYPNLYTTLEDEPEDLMKVVLDYTLDTAYPMDMLQTSSYEPDQVFGAVVTYLLAYTHDINKRS